MGNSDDVYLLRNQSIGFVFQSFNLLEDETVLDNVLMPAKIGRIETKKGSPAYNRALLLLEAVGLSSRAQFLSKFLSGGEKQRVAIARAFCNDPALILADEPSGNLDQAHSKAIHELLIGSAKKWNKALVIATHDEELASLCDKTYLLKDGSLTCIS
jgi:lipoprotein-releasing system ATP-binding protein